MRRNYRQPRRSSGDASSFWLSFSDLMSALVLIFVLVLLYVLYQYFDMYEISMAEIARQQFDLDAANTELATQQEKLTESEQQMIAQQIRLDAAQQELLDAEAILAAQQTALTDAQTALTDKETEIATQQAALDALSAQLAAQQTQITDQQTQLTTQQALLDDQQAQLEALVGVRTQIISALSQALRDANISAEVDKTTGAITLESDVLFGTGQSTLSTEGCKKIDEFLPVYLNVLFSDAYSGYVAEVIIEGHTDSTGPYLMNLQLSQDRALAVASYVLSDAYAGITAEQKSHLRQIATANGRSFSDPILINGVEDLDASRRVVFKFRLTDEQMIQQMQQLLENSGAAPAPAAPAAE